MMIERKWSRYQEDIRFPLTSFCYHVIHINLSLSIKECPEGASESTNIIVFAKFQIRTKGEDFCQQSLLSLIIVAY